MYERILDLFQLLQFVMHHLHKAMEMDALLGTDWQAVIETINKISLATSDATPQVKPLDGIAFFPQQKIFYPRCYATILAVISYDPVIQGLGMPDSKMLCRVLAEIRAPYICLITL